MRRRVEHAADCPANRRTRNEHSPCRKGDCPRNQPPAMTERELLGAIQDAVGLARNAIHNDRDRDQRATVERLLDRAWECVLEIRGRKPA